MAATLTRNWAQYYQTLTAQELVARSLSLTISVRRGNVSADEAEQRFAALEAEQARRVFVQAPELPVRRGARVLTAAGLGTVEGGAFHHGRSWHVVRYADPMISFERYGTAVAYVGPGAAVAVDAGTVRVEDEGNNVGRQCNVRGDGAAGEPCRCWIVKFAVSGSRYLVEHMYSGAVRLVGHRDMSNLY